MILNHYIMIIMNKCLNMNRMLTLINNYIKPLIV